MIKGPVWKEKFSLGVRKIDDQHKKLFDIINSVIDVYENRAPELIPALKELVDYVGYHFSTELEYMAEYDYPFYIEHNKEHQEFTARVIQYLDKIENEKRSLAREMLIFLKEWYVNHVLSSDQKLGMFLKSKIKTD